MRQVVISGTGLFTPTESISNAELVASFNQYVALFNDQQQKAIAAGRCVAKAPSDADFIEKASGIKSRFVVEKSGILDPTRMRPCIEPRPDDALSLQAEMAVSAAKEALLQAKKTPKDIDLVIVACSNMQRAYPAMAIEVQQALGCAGFAFDMNVACSSATFAIKAAQSFIESGAAQCVLVVNPEICTPQLNFCDRDSHFIFGDVATAVVVEAKECAISDDTYTILASQCMTEFSNNIRNNAGFINRLTDKEMPPSDHFFYQAGRKVFKEVTVKVQQQIKATLARLDLAPSNVTRLWLHQANANMNRLIAAKLMGDEVDEVRAPLILSEYANTASAGSIIALHLHRQGLQPGDIGLLCSFGAGYSMGTIILQKA